MTQTFLAKRNGIHLSLSYHLSLLDECIVHKFTQRLGITIEKIRALRAQWCHFIVWVALVMLTVLLEYSRLQLIL